VSWLLLVAVVGPSEVRAQCTKDTDCKYDRICVGGECVSPQEAGGNAGALGQAEQKKAACKQRCQHEQSKCDGKIRDGDADAGIRHRTCFVDHQRCLSDCGVAW
jgi:hypothetical protein